MTPYQGKETHPLFFTKTPMITSTLKLLQKATQKHYGVASFNVNNLEFLRAVFSAAETSRSPMMIEVSESAIAYASFDALTSMFSALAKQTKIPCSLHLDHGKNIAMIKKAIASGYFQSVMFDGSQLPYKQNVALTKKLALLAHKKGISLEAELGAIAGYEDTLSVDEKKAFFTDPKQAKDFVSKTRCDFLAISIGTAHGVHKFQHRSSLDFERLKEIRAFVDVPLVLHGASGIPAWLVKKFTQHQKLYGDSARLANAHGVSDAHVKKAIQLGIAKINIDSDLRVAFLAGLRDSLITDHESVDVRKLLELPLQYMEKVASEKFRLFNSAGKM